MGYNKERVNEWRANNREHYNEYMRNYRKSRPDWWKGVKRKHILKKYGLTPEEFGAIMEKQQGLCDICTRPLRDGKGGMTIDHNHITQKRRGFLCSQCNTILGMAMDDPAVLDSAIEYLRKWQ